jgi:hypothetical protein
MIRTAYFQEYYSMVVLPMQENANRVRQESMPKNQQVFWMVCQKMV